MPSNLSKLDSMISKLLIPPLIINSDSEKSSLSFKASVYLSLGIALFFFGLSQINCISNINLLHPDSCVFDKFNYRLRSSLYPKPSLVLIDTVFLNSDLIAIKHSATNEGS